MAKQTNSPELRRIVLARDNWKCMACGARKRLEVHHRHYRYYHCKNPHLEAEDCLTLCRVCHGRIHGKAANDPQYELELPVPTGTY